MRVGGWIRVSPDTNLNFSIDKFGNECTLPSLVSMSTEKIIVHKIYFLYKFFLPIGSLNFMTILCYIAPSSTQLKWPPHFLFFNLNYYEHPHSSFRGVNLCKARRLGVTRRKNYWKLRRDANACDGMR